MVNEGPWRGARAAMRCGMMDTNKVSLAYHLDIKMTP